MHHDFAQHFWIVRLEALNDELHQYIVLDAVSYQVTRPLQSVEYVTYQVSHSKSREIEYEGLEVPISDFPR